MINGKKAQTKRRVESAESRITATLYRSGMLEPGKDGIPLPRYPAPLARRLQQICASLIAEALADSGIVQLELATIRMVAEIPGIEQWRLADSIGMDRNNAGLVTDLLERKGLIERRVNHADRRARQLYLTRKGKLTFESLLPKIREANARILSPLPPRDQTLFLDLLVRLVEGNSAHARPGAGRRKRGSDLG
jgi:DNA-binding MarR family transcriptional regulator